MKALTLAVVLLTSSAALAQQAAPPAATATKGVAADTQKTTIAPQGIAPNQEAEMMRRPPPPGRPMPDQQERRGESRRNLVVLDRIALERRLARLEESLEDALDKVGDGRARGKVRSALEDLEDVKEILADAAPLGTGIPPPNQSPPYQPPPPVVQPMPDYQFQKLTAAMSRESFGKDKLRILTSATPREHFVVAQVIQVLNQFSFSQEKLEVVRVMKPTLLDMQNSYQLYNSFSFSSEKKRLQEILEN